ncbi:MAG: hypothetical protein GWN58_46590, partial [Anaerolineae bacterium]|nr:hypothetical protein [Anaerolineae bacterium]
LRERVGRELPGRARSSFWNALADSEVLTLLKEGKRQEAKRLANDTLATHVLKARGRGRRKTSSLQDRQSEA